LNASNKKRVRRLTRDKRSAAEKPKLGEFAMVITLMLTSQAFRDAFAAGTSNQGPAGRKPATRLVGQLLKGQDCDSCHAENHTVVGPAYVDIARKYAGTLRAIDRLVKSIREGETGTWGSASMPPHREYPIHSSEKSWFGFCHQKPQIRGLVHLRQRSTRTHSEMGRPSLWISRFLLKVTARK